MRQHYSIYLIFLAVALSYSCQREYVPENDYDRLIVLNGLLCADSLPIEITLQYTQSFSDTSAVKPVEGAEVMLYCNNQAYGLLADAGNGLYHSDSLPHPGQTYTIETQIDGKTISAETTIPLPLPAITISKDSIRSSNNKNYYYRKYDIGINDNPAGNEKYWIWILTRTEDSSQSGLNSIYSGCTFFDRFMASHYASSPFNYKTDFGTRVRLPDDQFNGRYYQFDVVPFGNTYPEDKSDLVYVCVFDKHYDNYLKSYLTYSSFLSMTHETPVTYTPSFIYSNVQNGTGILGSCSVRTSRFNFKKQY